MPEYFANDAASTLDGAINSSVTTFNVVDASAFPPFGIFRIKVDDEIMMVDSVSANTFTVTRGFETAPASHSNGADVVHLLTAGAMQRMVQSPGDATQYEIVTWQDASAQTASQSGMMIEGNVMRRIVSGEPVQVGYGLTVGTDNIVNPDCDNSFVCGVGGKALSPGEHVIAGRNSFDGTAGSAQTTTYLLKAVTTDTSSVEMFLDTTVGSTGSARMLIPPNYSWHYDIVVHTATRFYHYEGVAYNYGGSLFHPFGNPILVASYGLSEGFDSLTIAVDSSDDTLRLSLTSVNGTQYWLGKVVVSQVAMFVSGGGGS